MGRGGGWKTVVALVLLAVMGLELTRLFVGVPWARTGAHIAMLLLVPVSIRRLGLREAYLLTLCGALTWLLWVRLPDPAAVIDAALDQAAFLMGFILLISLVQEAARTSPAVIACGTYMARQPGSRQFLALFAGGNLMSVVFNLGAVSLIAPLVRRAAEEARHDPLTPIRERRQISAMLRGFAWSVVWSPTAVAPLALMQLIPGVDRGRWMALGLGVASAMLLVGLAEDRWRWRRWTAGARGVAHPAAEPFPAGAFMRFAAVCAAFAGLTGAVMALTGQGVPAGLMAAAPMLLVGWLVAQRPWAGLHAPANPDAAPAETVAGGRGAAETCKSPKPGARTSGAPKSDASPPGPVRTIGGRIRDIVRESLPLSAPAAVTLACSGYLGRAGAELVPAAELAARFGLHAMPGWLFLISLPLAVAALAQFALSPIMMAVFFGTLLGGIPDLPASPTLTALAISSGWALSMTCSPFASAVILLTRITGQPGTRLTWCWNAVFSLLAILTLTAAFWLLTGGR